jgi:glucose-1-phosphate thymidylyltransferase
MKGVVLAGGLGTRLSPLTRVTNKHLLPIYDKPMIYYPISYLVDCGIEDIMVVTGGPSAGDFLRLLGNGKEFGLKDLHYTYQRGEGGIAEALSLAHNFAGDDPVAVVLGDNIFEHGIHQALDSYPGEGAMILLKDVPDPQRFGVPRLEGEKVVEILEKPKSPPSPYAVVGAYVYDPRVFEIIDALEPSARGELEITDVNNAYIGWGEMRYGILDGWWTDAGTFDSLLQANHLVAGSAAAQVKIGPEDD